MMKNFTQHTKQLSLISGVKAFSLLTLLFFCGFGLQASNNSLAFSCANYGGDADNDGICDDKDNCDQYNPEQADYDLDGIGDLCDTSHDCDGITSIRRVQNLASACSGADNRIIWMEGAYCKEIGDLYFVEYDNNTATLKGSVKEVDGGNVAIVDITFTGKTNNGKPYEGCATLDHVSSWYYYANFFGTIGGYNVTPNPDHNFQVGFGANVKNDSYGASGWFKIDGKNADFNFDLGAPLGCATDCVNNGGDADGDGICDNQDNCDQYNPAQADYDNDGIGDLCDNSHDCANTSSIRRVQNLASACSGADDRVIWIEGAYCKEIGDLYFIEYTDGTAKLQGSVKEVDGDNISIVDVTFTGKTNTGVPYDDCATLDYVADWYYYADFSGTIGGHEVTPNPNHNFQVGFGANVKNDNYGASGWFTLNGQNTDFNFDLSDPLTCVVGSIGDYVWEDDNANGVQDDNEPGLPGVFVFLEDEFGNDVPGVMYQVTGPNGEYSFDNLPLGKYVVKFATPSGFVLTDQAKGGDNDKDSDASIIDGKTDVIMLTETNPDVTNIDAGYGVPIKLIGYVWTDENQDGFQDATELPKEGVRVFLIDAGDDMIAGTADDMQVGFTYTDGAGLYTFHNVQPGKYFVNFDLTPLAESNVFTEPDFVADDFKDSDADIITGNSPVFMLNAFSPSSGVDAGIILASNLPVELISFGAKKSNCFTALNWATSVELDFSHFEVEHSVDAKNYKRINTTKTQGGSGVQYYYFTDKNTAEINYYRLKMVDLDGSFEYSDALNVNHDCNSAFGLSIFPNPINKFDGEVSVKFFSEVELTNIHIVDAMGRVISSQEYQVSLEWNVENIDVSNLQSGLYYIMIDGNRNAGRFMITE